MVDKLSIGVTLVIAALVIFTMLNVAAKLDDPEYMCKSALGEEWEPAENVTPPENGHVCEASNGSVETVVIQNVTQKSMQSPNIHEANEERATVQTYRGHPEAVYQHSHQRASGETHE